MIRAYKFLMRPTVRQTAALGEMLRDHCSLYNGALQERRDAYRHPSKTSIRYGMQSAQLKDIRAFDPERQGRWSFSSQQATLRRLDKAFAAFFRRVTSGDTPGYPRFRGVNWFDTVEFPKDGDGCRWDSTSNDPVTRVRLQGIGHVKVNQHRPVVGRVKTVSVKREGRKWFVVLTAEQHQPEPLPATGSVVIRNMSRAPSPKPDPDQPGAFLPNGAAAKAGLNRSIADAGWGVFLTILHAKAESAGREVIAVDPRNTSRTCPECGHVSAENRPHPGEVPLRQLRPQRTRRHSRSHQRSTGRAGPSRRQPGIARSPRLQPGEESHLVPLRGVPWGGKRAQRTGRPTRCSGPAGSAGDTSAVGVLAAFTR